jgi:hypothetical protein
MTPTPRFHEHSRKRLAVPLLVIVAFVRVVAAEDPDVTSDHPSKIPAELESLRFRSVFSLADVSATSAVGEFTLRGPIVSTLRSLPYLSSGPVVFDDDGRVYVGPYRLDRELFQREQWSKDTIGRVPTWAGCQTFDSRRKHLVGVGFGGFLHRYDVEARRWLDRLPFGESPRCMVYDPDRDVLVTIAAGDKLRVYSPEGELQETRDITPPITLPRRHSVQATWHAERGRARVILVTSAVSSRKEGEQPGRVFVIDPREARTIYAGNIELLDDAGRPFVWKRSTLTARPADEHPLPRLRAAYEALAHQLTAAQKVDFEDRLAELREHIAGDYGTRRDRAAEIHVLAMDVRDFLRNKVRLETTVKLDYRCRPVVLVLMTDFPNRFRLELGEQTRVNRIYLLGPSGTGIVEPPPKVECVQWPYRTDDPRMPEFSSDSRQGTLPGLMRAALQADYSTMVRVQRDRPDLLNVTPIGPADADWRRQHIASLVREFELRIEKLRIASHRFLAVNQPDEADLRGPREALMAHSEQRGRSFWGEFDVTGPRRHSLRPLPIRATLLADGGPGHRFVADPTAVYQLDETHGQVTSLPWGSIEAPELVTGLAVNIKKKRLFAAVICGDREIGHVKHPALYQLDLESRRWTRAGYLGRHVTGLAYDGDRDVLYGFHGHARLTHSLAELFVLTTRGVRLASVYFPFDRSWDWKFGPPQVFWVADRLVVLTAPRVPYGRDESAVSEVFIVDPIAATQVFAGAIEAPQSSR